MFNSGTDNTTMLVILTVALPIVIGVMAWVVVKISSDRSKARMEADKLLAGALHQSSEVNVRLLEKLTEIDTRLKSVEKTLTDIPS